MESQRLILRLNSCQEALHTITSMINHVQPNDQVARQLQQLEQLMSAIDSSLITEVYMRRIENASNQLFNELTRLFQKQRIGSLYEQAKH